MRSALRCGSSLTLSATYISRFMPASVKDRGGNSVDVRFNRRKENLHSLWDTALVELEEGTPAEVATRIQATTMDADLQQWQQGTPAEWALESLAIVRTQAYRLPHQARSPQVTSNQHAL